MDCGTICDRVTSPFSFNYCSSLPNTSPCKKRKKSSDCSKYDGCLPILRFEDYYTEPSLDELSEMEEIDPGYCGRVRGFTIGRVGFGNVKFVGETDVRELDLGEIVKFNRHEVVVYEDESVKPPVGEGLNKDAVVTLVLKVGMSGGAEIDGVRFRKVVDRLRFSAYRQGADFASYDPVTGEWRFRVKHFSRFGLSLDDEDDIVMDDVDEGGKEVVMNGGIENDGFVVDDDFDVGAGDPELSHSLPAHLGLDPAKMRDMRMMMFSGDGDEDEEYDKIRPRGEHRSSREKSPLYNSGLRNSKPSSPSPRKTPVPLLEYKSSNLDAKAPGTLLLAQQKKGLPLRVIKSEGFKLESDCETPVSGYHSRNIVDAGLFMGRSFRVGWGPGGVLIHSGTPVGGNDRQRMLSSVITLQKVAIDKVTRDENNEVKKEAVDSLFDPLLDLHRSLSHKTEDVEMGSFNLSLQKVLCDRLTLPDICRGYIGLIDKQVEVPGLPASVHLSFVHQVMVWELIKVLFSERESSRRLVSGVDHHDDEMMLDGKARESDFDFKALPLMRRAEFSFWLHESVYHRVQADLSNLSASSDLEGIFLLLSGRQLDAAVELAASRGDVRLACLISEAGGSMVNRSDIAQQLDLWRINGMDFRFMEKDRLRLYELLSGNIHSAADGKVIDWKRFLGLLMWYDLPPETDLPAIFRTYQHLVTEEKAPYPVPAYIDEGPPKETMNSDTEGTLDLAYHLMLLHATEGCQYSDVKSMFSAFASTSDPLDYHMIWHQRGILEAIDAFRSNDLHILDMAYVSQLLCLGKCHWAIYVVLHMSYNEEFPHLHSTVIREILFQYCETWSTSDEQSKFIEDLGVPSQWLHEARAVYFQYYGDLPEALEHYIKCASWQKAHSIFISSVVHSLFLAAKDSEIWRLATLMEDHKSEIEDWDLGGGVYIAFYLLRSSLQDGDNDMTKLESLESREAACREFFDQLNKSLAVLENKLPTDARVAYSKMAEEICSLLLPDSVEGSSFEGQMKCFSTAATAPIPEDLRSHHLQDAVSLFACSLAEAAF